MTKQEMLDVLQVDKNELTVCKLTDAGIYIEGSSDMEDGHYIIYGGPDWRCLGPYPNEQQALFAISGEVTEGLFESYDTEELTDAYSNCFDRDLEFIADDDILEHTEEGIKQVSREVVILRLYEYYL